MQEPNPQRSLKVRFSSQNLLRARQASLAHRHRRGCHPPRSFSFNVFNPGPKPLTDQELSQKIASAMASATPPPALAARVYAGVQPSLVQVETKILSTDGKEEGGRRGRDH